MDDGDYLLDHTLVSIKKALVLCFIFYDIPH